MNKLFLKAGKLYAFKMPEEPKFYAGFRDKYVNDMIAFEKEKAEALSFVAPVSNPELIMKERIKNVIRGFFTLTIDGKEIVPNEGEVIDWPGELETDWTPFGDVFPEAMYKLIPKNMNSIKEEDILHTPNQELEDVKKELESAKQLINDLLPMASHRLWNTPIDTEEDRVKKRKYQSIIDRAKAFGNG